MRGSGLAVSANRLAIRPGLIMRTSSLIHNFVGSQSIEVAPHVSAENGNTVAIYADGGALSFQFDMRPEEARRMANKLIEYAELVEA